MLTFDSWRVSVRIQVLVGLSLAGLLLLTIAASLQLRASLLEDRKSKVKNLIEYALTQLAFYDKEARAGRLTLEQAQQSAKETLRVARYGNNDYFWINDMHPRSVMHPIKPEVEGTDVSGNKDAVGAPLYQKFVDTVKASGAGFVEYQWVRSQGAPGVPKLSYVKGFEPWGWVVGTGIYIDDVDSEFRQQLLRLGGISLVLFLLLGLLGWRVGGSILRHLGGEPSYAAEVTRRIAAGDLTQEVTLERRGGASLLASLAEMQGRLAQVFGQIDQAAVRLSRNASALSTAAAEIGRAAEAQAQATSASAAALEEVTVSINEVSALAGQTETGSERTATLSSQSVAAIGRSGDRNRRHVSGCCFLVKAGGRPAQAFGRSRRHRQRNPRDCRSDQSAGAQRGHRGGAGRRARPGFRGGRRRGAQAGRTYRQGNARNRPCDQADPE